MPRFWHKRRLSGTSKKLRRSAAKTSVLPVQNPADIQNGKHVPSHSFERRCERTCFPVSFCDQKSFKPSSFKSKAFSYFIASATATATATVAPTMGLLPMLCRGSTHYQSLFFDINYDLLYRIFKRKSIYFYISLFSAIFRYKSLFILPLTNR